MDQREPEQIDSGDFQAGIGYLNHESKRISVQIIHKTEACAAHLRALNVGPHGNTPVIMAFRVCHETNNRYAKMESARAKAKALMADYNANGCPRCMEANG